MSIFVVATPFRYINIFRFFFVSEAPLCCHVAALYTTYLFFTEVEYIDARDASAWIRGVHQDQDPVVSFLGRICTSGI